MVLLIEGKTEIGGGLRAVELTLPGYLHDVCSAIHPLAVSSPYLKTLPLKQFGLEYIYPDVAVAHPFDSGTAAVLKNSVADTARLLRADAKAYKKLIQPIVDAWPAMATDV